VLALVLPARNAFARACAGAGARVVGGVPHKLGAGSGEAQFIVSIGGSSWTNELASGCLYFITQQAPRSHRTDSALPPVQRAL